MIKKHIEKVSSHLSSRIRRMRKKFEELRGALRRKVEEARAKRKVFEQEVARFKIGRAVKIPVLPEVKRKAQIDVRYPLIPPFAYVRVKWNDVEKSLVYQVIEPELSDEEKEIFSRLEDALTKVLELELGKAKTFEEALGYLKKKTLEVLDEQGIELKPGQFTRIFYYIYRNFIGLNEIEPLMHDAYIEDLGCDGINVPIYIVHKKYGEIKTNVLWTEGFELQEFIVKLAERCGRYISYAEPLLDGSLPDGSRVQATLAKDVTRRGPTFSIRKFREIPYSAIDLVKLGTASIEMMAYLWYIIEHRKNIMIVGGTATGKCVTGDTPVLLSSGERVAIEDFIEKAFNRADRIGQTSDGWFCCEGDATVLSLNPQTLKIEPSRINFFWKRAAPPEMLEICTSSGRIKVTPEHPFFTINESGLAKIRASEIQQNDFIVAPRKLTIVPNTFDFRRSVLSSTELAYVVSDSTTLRKIKTAAKGGKLKRATAREWASGRNKIPLRVLRKISTPAEIAGIKQIYTANGVKVDVPTSCEEIAELFGYLVADGHLTKNYIEFHNSSESLLKRFLWLAERAFGVKGKIEMPKKRVPRARVYNVLIAEIFNKVFNVPFGKKASTIDLPGWLCSERDEILAKALRAIFDCESSVSKKQADIELTSASEKFIHSLAFALRRFGIVSHISRRRYGFRLVVSNKKNLLAFAKGVGFFDKFKMAALSEHIKNSEVDGKVSYHSNVDLLPAGAILRKLQTKFRQQGVSDREIALAAGVSRRGYERIAAGERNPTPLMLTKISSALKTKAVQLKLSRAQIEEIDFLTQLAASDIVMAKVKEIKKIASEEKWVYDLTISNNHNFVAGENGGFIAHNTTFLNSISIFIPPEEKIVSIEDTAELNLPHENWLPAVARIGFGMMTREGVKYGEVTMFDLLKESFRQAPDYVIVGEVRGKEASVLFQGMASIPPNERLLILNNGHLKEIPAAQLERGRTYHTFAVDPATNGARIASAKVVAHSPRNLLYRITTKTGRQVTVTPDHSLFTFDRHGLRMIRADELKSGAKIALIGRLPCGYNDISHINLLELEGIRVFAPHVIRDAVKKIGFEQASKMCHVRSISDYYSNFKRALPSALSATSFTRLMSAAQLNPSLDSLKVRFDRKSKSLPATLKITDELMRLCGYYLAEGSLDIGRKSNRISLYNNNDKILKDMRRCVSTLVKPISERPTKGFGGCTELSFSHKVLFELFKQFCGMGKTKRIPNFVYGLSKRRIGQFLAALYDGDGWFSKTSKSSERYVFGYSTSSQQLAVGLQQLLATLGIVARIRKKKERSGKVIYHILFYRRADQEEFLTYARPLKAKIKFTRPERKNWSREKADIYIDNVKSIEKIQLRKPVPVFDLHVPKFQNFASNSGILLHNSGHASLGTMHGGSVDDIVRRLQTPPIELPGGLLEVLDVFVVISKTPQFGKSARRIKLVHEFIGIDLETGKTKTNVCFEWIPAEDSHKKIRSVLIDEISKDYGIPREQIEQEIETRERFLRWLLENKIFNFQEVSRYISLYYKDKEEALKLVGQPLAPAVGRR